jgi:hypothetical protein
MDFGFHRFAGVSLVVLGNGLADIFGVFLGYDFIRDDIVFPANFPRKLFMGKSHDFLGILAFPFRADLLDECQFLFVQPVRCRGRDIFYQGRPSARLDADGFRILQFFQDSEIRIRNRAMLDSAVFQARQRLEMPVVPSEIYEVRELRELGFGNPSIVIGSERNTVLEDFLEFFAVDVPDSLRAGFAEKVVERQVQYGSEPNGLSEGNVAQSFLDVAVGRAGYPQGFREKALAEVLFLAGLFDGRSGHSGIGNVGRW